MTPFSTLVAAIALSTDGYTVTLPDDWLQGRTAYGGLSAALCYEAASRAFTDLPPLRSAQFCFIGPAGGTVTIVPTILRQGRSTVFVSVDLMAESGLAARALLSFGAARESAFDYSDLAMPAVAAPEQCESFFGGRPGPSFAKHFDSRLAGGFRPITGAPEPDMLLWLRHFDEATPNDLTALIALADAAPPAAMTQFTTPAPISTMTWSIDMLAPAPADDSGWRLMRTTAESTMAGYSAQAMMIWGPGGEPLMVARQNVAIFA
ncbi:thioesterase family protein [Oleomonas cavernae]|uniref:Thioesterase family protein n=1 Tax=Oleomonas cavernae TaxID=2320859 RepID=A0A418WAB1_9PROT|nr:thioesterase family protein [Oleomonas cavernae]RJF86908.1 thioesterase family protein [Oleomonas cavernae]